MKIAVFSSVGDDQKFFDYFRISLQDKCDLFVNYYGEGYLLGQLKNYAKYVSVKKTTKFPALHNAYFVSDIKNYDYILVFDDDCIVESGNLLDIIKTMDKHNLKIASPCHSRKGKISHSIMTHRAGNHIFRYTNFIEMNFPIFSKSALHDYMSVYDGSLCGWGNDWWYLSVLNSDKIKNTAILDSVSVINTHKTHSSIDNYIPREARKAQWRETKHAFGLNEWEHKNLEFIY